MMDRCYCCISMLPLGNSLASIDCDQYAGKVPSEVYSFFIGIGVSSTLIMMVWLTKNWIVIIVGERSCEEQDDA